MSPNAIARKLKIIRNKGAMRSVDVADVDMRLAGLASRNCRSGIELDHVLDGFPESARRVPIIFGRHLPIVCLEKQPIHLAQVSVSGRQRDVDTRDRRDPIDDIPDAIAGSAANVADIHGFCVAECHGQYGICHVGDMDVVTPRREATDLDRRGCPQSAHDLGYQMRMCLVGADRVEDPLDVPIGDGASALLLRSTTDIIANRFFWMSGTVRFVKPYADNIAVALPFLTDSTIFTPFRVGSAQRSLGQRIEIELAPRLMLGQFFGVSGAYLLRRVGSGQFKPQGTIGVVDCGIASICPAIVSQTTAATTVHALSIGASFSSLASYMRGGAKWPLELLFSHTAPISASGGIQPIFSTDRLELKIYRKFPRR